MKRHLALLLAFLSFSIFVCADFFQVNYRNSVDTPFYSERVVVSAPVLIVVYGGDRFLAANLETIRLASTSMDSRGVDTNYLIRAQQEVALLNACHEDNYYLANGLLTWGGAVEAGSRILQKAMDCRRWDGMPAFFYGVNLAFFEHDIDRAVNAIEIAAMRWPENTAALRKLAVMLRAESYTDERLALTYLKSQRDSAVDPTLRSMLDKRVVRLSGLLRIRAAQRRYELEHGSLTSLKQLVGSGFLQALPVDPLGLGYELDNGLVILKRMKIVGVED